MNKSVNFLKKRKKKYWPIELQTFELYYYKRVQFQIITFLIYFLLFYFTILLFFMYFDQINV